MLLLSGTMVKNLSIFSATPATEVEFVWGNYTKIVEDRFFFFSLMKTLFLTEEQVKARHDFFARRYNIDT